MGSLIKMLCTGEVAPLSFCGTCVVLVSQLEAGRVCTCITRLRGHSSMGKPNFDLILFRFVVEGDFGCVFVLP